LFLTSQQALPEKWDLALTDPVSLEAGHDEPDIEVPDNDGPPKLVPACMETGNNKKKQ